MQEPPRPHTPLSKAEARLLEQCWKLGTCSVREILESLPEDERVAYTTVQTLVHRLEQKGAKRTLYNNYPDKRALFTLIVEDTIAFAAKFAGDLREEFFAGITAANLRPALEDLGRRLALGIVRPKVIALRRLLVGEAREFPGFAAGYYDRAPGKVLEALASGFERLRKAGLLRVDDPRQAAAQFAYLVAGEPLDRAILLRTLPPEKRIVACASEGVKTFLARYGGQA